ncbi:hypothetical protein OG874_30745 [Nocardia sp. NBC_00565]|uniref:hypothetical protein n=1 Tax=Nocardia sp. NBC_00565 TaxID=2975993 RepID=UPI002E8097A4|nr:hypothetical protein [Nocardia sp. NBC_00565]WUC01171.1 hypothetical protein OG874_30745 [Nocardia sp. NBC_00565]
MASRRPVNRVTPRNRPTVGRTAASAGSAATRRTARATDESTVTTKRRAQLAGATEPVRPARQPAPSRPLAQRLRLGRGWGLVAALFVVTVLLGVFAAVAALRPGIDDSNDAYIDSKATEEVTAAASHALKTIYAYDVNKLDGYKDAVHSVVTGQMLADFDKYADTNLAALKQAQTSADALADPIGVTLLTDDRAELLVNFVVSANKNGVAQQSASGPIVVKMQKVDGKWLAAAIVDQ